MGCRQVDSKVKIPFCVIAASPPASIVRVSELFQSVMPAAESITT